jgi:DHA3 family macrolide efflux protein-like MFS transporter
MNMRESALGKWIGRMPRGMLVFLLVWFGQVVSLLGSGMTCFAQNVTVYTDMGGSIANLGVLAVLAQVPGIILSPVAGVLADRFDRRKMMLVCDSVAALATLSLRVLIVTGVYQIWHIYVFAVIISIANHFQWPAYFAAIPTLVPKERLGQANGLVAVGRAIGQIAAPVLAGFAVSTFKLEGVILFDLATFVFAASILLFVRFPKPQPLPEASTRKVSFWREMKYGMDYLFSRRGLLGIMVLIAVGNFVLGGIGVLVLPVMVTMASIQDYGYLASLGGISMLLGGLIVSIWGVPKNRVRGLLVFMGVQGLAILIGGWRPSLLLFTGMIVLFYFTSTIVNACAQVIWQSKVPPAVQGRVLAFSTLFTAGALELGILAVSLPAESIMALFDSDALPAILASFFGSGYLNGLISIVFVLGVIYVIAILIGSFYPRIRFLEQELPDMLPAADTSIPGMTGQPSMSPLYEVDFEGNIPSTKIRMDK